MRPLALHAAVLALLAILLAPGVAGAHDEPAPIKFGAQDRDFTQRHLDIHVRPDFERRAIGGHVGVRFAALKDGLKSLRLHCQDTTVHKVTDEAGAYLGFELERNLLTIRLGRTLQKDEEYLVRIDYSSVPRMGLFFHGPSKATPNAPTWVYSQGQASQNRRWIPCYDEPDDRTSWDLSVEVPERLQTVSNGILVEQKASGDGMRIDKWHFADRSPTYLISLVCGEMLQVTEKAGEVDLEYNAPKGHATEATLRRALKTTPAMLKFFDEYIGTPYPWARYAQTLVWDFVYGGMENVTATTLNMRVLHTDADRPAYRSDALVAHELVHMWFGDLITCRTWEHLWLNEGFATYFTDLFFEHHFGAEEFMARRRRQNERYMDSVPKPEELDVKRTERGDIPLELGGWKAYNRGAAILHMLRRELGDAVFQAGVQRYVQRHKDQAVVSEQLRRVMEDVSGRDLEWFWDQWIYGAGYPVIEVENEYGPDGKLQALLVRQVQKHSDAQGLFRMTLDVRTHPDARPHRVTIHQAEHRFTGVFGNVIGPSRIFDLVGKTKSEKPASYVYVAGSSDVLARVRVKQSLEAWESMLQWDLDADARIEAVRGLEQFGDDGIGAIERAITKDRSWTVRRECALVLGSLGGKRVVQSLLAAAIDIDPRVRAEVATALASTDAERAGETLLRMAQKDVSDYVRSAAARSLGRLHHVGADPLLTKLLDVDSHREIVRRGALDGLAALGDPSAIPLAKRFLPYAVSKGAMHQVRQAALDCMMTLGPDREDVHATLVGLLDDPYFRMRQWAATACGVYGVKTAKHKLENLRHHDWNSGVRGEAFRALEKMGLLPK